MADFGSLFEDPVFTAGLSLLGGARERNPWMAAQQQMQQWQALQQQGKQRKLQEQLAQEELQQKKDDRAARSAQQARIQAYVDSIEDPKQRQLAALDAEEWVKAQLRAPKLTSVAPGATLINENDPSKPVFTAPAAPPKPIEVERMLQLLDDPNMSPANKQIIAQVLQKQMTHAPAAMAISYGSPMPMLNKATGEVEFVQPSNRAGAPAQAIPGYTQPPDKSANKMPAEIQRMDIALDTALAGLDSWDKMLKDYNPRRNILDPKWRAKIDAASADLKLQLKEANALGALTGPDVGILEDLIGTPGSPSAPIIGQAGLQAKSAEARAAILRRKKAVNARYGKDVPAAPAAQAAPSNKQRRRFNPETGSLE